MPGARKFFPAAEFVTVPEAGHWVHADNPDFVVRAMEEFFA
jgi:pimeloyl-ACP methyl ester carboxylesterase